MQTSMRSFDESEMVCCPRSRSPLTQPGARQILGHRTHVITPMEPDCIPYLSWGRIDGIRKRALVANGSYLEIANPMSRGLTDIGAWYSGLDHLKRGNVHTSGSAQH
jgi:hypothetical protein